VGQTNREVYHSSLPPTLLFDHSFFYQSLAATIKQRDLNLKARMIEVADTEAISEEPSENFFAQDVSNVEGIGEPISACFFINTLTDPKDW